MKKWMVAGGILLAGLLWQTPVQASLSLAPQKGSPLVSYTVKGEIVAKGMVRWEERLTPAQAAHIHHEYMVLKLSKPGADLLVLECTPLFVSVDQFHLGEHIQAEVAEDGSLISARSIH